MDTGKKYRFRAQSPFKRMQWLQCLNAYTQNLTDDLKDKNQTDGDATKMEALEYDLSVNFSAVSNQN